MTTETAACARCACVIDPPELVPDDGDETFCDYCTMEIDLEHEREKADEAREQMERARRGEERCRKAYAELLVLANENARAMASLKQHAAMLREAQHRHHLFVERHPGEDAGPYQRAIEAAYMQIGRVALMFAEQSYLPRPPGPPDPPEPRPPECSICRMRHGREIEHACE